MAGSGFLSKFFRRDRPQVENPVEVLDLNTLCVGDLVRVQGFHPDMDDAMLEVTNIHSYTANDQTWWEAMVSDRGHRLRLEWSGEGDDIQVAASDDFDPVGLDGAGITEADLLQLDDEKSLDNRLFAFDRHWHYRNSHETRYHQDRAGEGVGFWMWDLVAADGDEIMAVVKFENAPFEVHRSWLMDPDAIEIYPGEGHFNQEGEG